MLDRIPGLIHERLEVGKVGGAVCKSIIDSKAQLSFIRGLALRSQLCPIVKKLALAMKLGVDDYGQVIFQIDTIREPPYCSAEPMKSRNLCVQFSAVEL